MTLPFSPTQRRTDDPPGGAAWPPADTALLLSRARMLQHEARSGRRQPWLRGKNIGLFGAAEHRAETALFRRAAVELGARVAQIPLFPQGTLASAEVQLTARLIGRLYDAVDWPDAPADLLERVRADAGIPIYDGLAAARHPTAQLAGQLGADASLADRRRFVLQAVLLATII